MWSVLFVREDRVEDLTESDRALAETVRRGGIPTRFRAPLEISQKKTNVEPKPSLLMISRTDIARQTPDTSIDFTSKPIRVWRIQL